MQEFVVNNVETRGIDLGVSDFYGGLVLLPSNFTGSQQLVLRFFPSTSPSGMDEIMVW